eukprot:10601431-Prorocentrum_lima.AAC.1
MKGKMIDCVMEMYVDFYGVFVNGNGYLSNEMFKEDVVKELGRREDSSGSEVPSERLACCVS